VEQFIRSLLLEDYITDATILQNILNDEEVLLKKLGDQGIIEWNDLTKLENSDKWEQLQLPPRLKDKLRSKLDQLNRGNTNNNKINIVNTNTNTYSNTIQYSSNNNNAAQKNYNANDDSNTSPGLERFKQLLIQQAQREGGEPWYFEPTGRYRSSPYQPTVLSKEPPPPNPDKSIPLPPKIVLDETERVSSLLAQHNRTKLAEMFRKCYPNTLHHTAVRL